MKQIKVSEKLNLPPEIVTLTSAILGIRNSGKTNTAVVITEGLLDAGHQVVVIDPLDVWWGLKSSADGKSEGYPVVVIGGPHGDLPLAATDGKTIADFVVENPVPVILSMRHLSKSDQKRLVADFAEQLYRRKGENGRATPLLVVIDEASSFVPQRFTGDSARMVGAIEDLVRRGRASGIGVALIDQRAASINKDVLTQLELLIAHRHTSPQDRGALESWVEAHDTGGQSNAFMESLAALKQGEAWFWSPGWLDLFQRVQVRERRTFDSSATPKLGAAAPVPKKLAAVDLDKLKVKLTQTIEKARADDPRELRKQIADLQKQLRHIPAAKPKIVETPVVTDKQVRRVETVTDRIEVEGRRRIEAAEKLAESGRELLEMARDFAAALGKARAPLPPITHPAILPRRPIATPRRVDAPASIPGEGITARQQRMLDAAATLTTLGVEVSRETVSAWLGIHPRGGSVGEELKALADAGLVSVDRGNIAVTQAGMSAAEQCDPNEAIDRAKGGLTDRQAKFFDLIVAAYPGAATREEIAEHFQIHPRGGSLGEDLGRLIKRGLVEGGRGQYRARDFLFAGQKL
jgi:hypothetical protein